LDAGEGVRMMFDVIDRAKLYLPIFFTQPDIPRDAVQVVLLNQARPSTWDQVQYFLRDHPTIGNAEVRRILRTDNPVKASKLLKSWLDAGLLVTANPEVGARLRLYRLPGALPEENLFSFVAGKQVQEKNKDK